MLFTGNASFLNFLLIIVIIFVGIVISVTIQLLLLKIAIKIPFVRNLLSSIIDEALR